MVNKIYIDTSNYDLEISDNLSYLLEIEHKTALTIVVKEKVTSTLNILVQDSLVSISLVLYPDSFLNLNLLGNNSSINFSAELWKATNLNCTINLLSSFNSINNLTINQKASHSKAKVLLSGINDSKTKLYFVINGLIKKDCVDVVLDEKSRIINLLPGDSKIIPNLIVDSQDVKANHAAFIGNFDSNILNYLSSRGISEKRAKELLIEGVLLANFNFNDTMLDKFREFLELKIKDRKGGD